MSIKYVFKISKLEDYFTVYFQFQNIFNNFFQNIVLLIV
jgi:hypothetical protein